LKEALKLCGYSFDVFPGRSGLYSPCGLGGCWACSILVDGVLTRSCITGVRDRMKIETNGSDTAPLGIIHGPEPHTVGVKLLPSLKVGVWINM
jgi:pyruvate formate lyase activating enzyme